MAPKQDPKPKFQEGKEHPRVLVTIVHCWRCQDRTLSLLLVASSLACYALARSLIVAL